MTGNPVIIFAVKGTIAAGDEPLPWIYYPQSQKGVYPCVEIMTGATFPPTSSSSSSSSSSTTSAPARDEHPFDCCVSYSPTACDGVGFCGVETVRVLRRLRVGVFSTESKLINYCGGSIGDRGRGHFGIPDVNGPFIYAVLEAQGCDVDFLGAMEDNG
ncbi:uncharacterized protein BDCG_17731 [Blastomyces dermatitidis ER-3]|uniref:Uncharacterized protein n=1 Tax=Ajellomyces dermatitidis (strain ER-3 / ATCC MYA-2586) TaxID=559297 RepID=A0ABX2VZZ6_AJEDR|nr:uncharacterized protein BDCG_17731 [Blastomyces dermatitidis ER-3]OAT02701.1 hypothetical protein BDCG_17731 [Blastomyces dermatitidis ER-3]